MGKPYQNQGINATETYENDHNYIKLKYHKKLQEIKKAIGNNRSKKYKVRKLSRKLKKSKCITKMMNVLFNFDRIINKSKHDNKTDWITPKSCAKIKRISKEVEMSTNKYDILKK